MKIFKMYKGRSLWCGDVENLSEKIARAVDAADSMNKKFRAVENILNTYTIIKDPYEIETGGFLWRLFAPLLFILFVSIRFIIMPIKFVITGDSWFQPDALISKVYSYVGRKTGLS
jgi:hypothetical protein